MFETKELLRFHSLFKSNGFVFSVIRPSVKKDGFWTPAHDEMSKIASDFISALHNSGAIDPKFMDKTVVSADRSYQLRNNSDAMNSASLFEVSHVLTFLTRAERFTPGTITTAYNSGLLVRALERLSTIDQSNE